MPLVFTAALWSFLVVFVLCLIHVLLRTKYNTAGTVATIVLGIISWFLSWLFVWLTLYGAKPAFVGVFYGMWFLLIPLTITLIITIAADFIASADYGASIGAGWAVSLVAMVVIGFMGLYASCGPVTKDDGLKLAQTISVTNESETDYPDTDVNHMVQVPEEAARFKASNVVAEKAVTEDNGQIINLSTAFYPGKLELQSVQNHLYWIAPLDFSSWTAWKQVSQVSPGYIVVDAEDPNVDPQVRIGYKMRYTNSAYISNELSRRLYINGFNDWSIDDLTLEVDDDWRPWFTASLNRPILRGTGSIPQKFIIVDPQKFDGQSDVQVFDLKDSSQGVPDWVDRVYSKDAVIKMVNWWGDYSNTNNPAKFCCNRSSAGRYKVASDPVLVYTKGDPNDPATSGHPNWQILITSLNDDTSATGLMLFDARDNKARLYPILAGTPIESQMTAIFAGISLNSRDDWEPQHLSVHKIYGQAVWVASYVLAKGNTSQGKSFTGIGFVVAAKDVNAADVAFASNKQEALSLFRAKLAHQTSNQAPEENSQNKDLSGTIETIATQFESGETIYLMTLTQLPGKVFKANRTVSLELAFAKSGDKVAIRYQDVNSDSSVPYDIGQFNDLDLPIVQ